MTVDILLLRHGPTLWNREKRIQGRTDIPLSAEGLAAQAERSLPSGWQQAAWYSSPLQRARQTAAALGLEVQLAPLLIEMDWGEWEGQRLPELRQQLGPAMQTMEDRGLDLCPPGGESPRQVQQRLYRWCEEQALQASQLTEYRVGAVTHKGVIRAALAAACDWNMLGRAPAKLDWQRAHWFRWQQGRLSLVQANC